MREKITGAAGAARREKRRVNFMARPPRMIISSFAGIIGVGTLLLMLPISARSGAVTPLADALFTATSATCVTGLILFDTYTYWSPFGQAVILCLIQLGGLGLLTFTAFFNLLIGRKMGLRGMQVASESINSDTVAELPRMIKLAVTTSLAVEAVGAVLLCLFFVPLYGSDGVTISIFTAISAFCNAGFDILGRESPFISLCNYNGHPFPLLVIMFLIIIGGLGFVVWRDLLEAHRTRRLSLHTKIVLMMSGVLIVAGTLLFLVMEWTNPATLGSLPAPQRFTAALFQSVSCRTAGFNSIDIASMRELTKGMAIVLMFIGAAPGSTGGGIKVTALAVIIMTVVCVTRGMPDTVIMRRRVSKNVVYRALTVVIIALAVVGCASLVISATNNITDVGITGTDVMFESVSAFATVGLSAGVSGVANLPSKLVLIMTMFMGRVGPISVLLSLALRTETKRKEVIPDGKIYL